MSATNAPPSGRRLAGSRPAARPAADAFDAGLPDLGRACARLLEPDAGVGLVRREAAPAAADGPQRFCCSTSWACWPSQATGAGGAVRCQLLEEPPRAGRVGRRARDGDSSLGLLDLEGTANPATGGEHEASQPSHTRHNETTFSERTDAGKTDRQNSDPSSSSAGPAAGECSDRTSCDWRAAPATPEPGLVTQRHRAPRISGRPGHGVCGGVRSVPSRHCAAVPLCRCAAVQTEDRIAATPLPRRNYAHEADPRPAALVSSGGCRWRSRVRANG